MNQFNNDLSVVVVPWVMFFAVVIPWGADGVVSVLDFQYTLNFAQMQVENQKKIGGLPITPAHAPPPPPPPTLI